MKRVCAFLLLTLGVWIASAQSAEEAAAPAIRHSYLVMGGQTAIIGEDGKSVWEYRGGSRDGFILPNGNALIAWSDRAEEVTTNKQVVFSYVLSKENREI